MKIFFATVLTLHALIHLLGFIKGFQWAEVPNLSASITRTAGLFWLTAFLLLGFSAGLYWANQPLWIWLATAGMVLSTILIVPNWSDAKFGMIPNVFILILLLGTFADTSFNRKIRKETESMMAQVDTSTAPVISGEDLVTLPEAVKQWLSLSGVVGKPLAKTVWLRQNFKMKLKPEQETWYEAVAEQRFTTENPAFIWTVKLNMSPFISITGRDKFMNGQGEMEMRMNALISLGKETGPKMDEGTLQRYLGEMVWFPSAVLSPYVTWEEVDPLTAKATMSYRGTSGSGLFYFDEQGNFVKFSAWRYKGNDAHAKRYEWIITVDDYAEFEGIRIPSKCLATWMLDEGPWTWAVLEVTDLCYDKMPKP